MPFSGGANDRKLAQAVRDGKISEEFLDQMVDRLIDLAKKSEKVLGNDTYDATAHHALAREIAGQCMVLLKNEGGLLPLKKKQRVAVIGEMAKRPRYQGAGSSQINPTQLDCAYDTMLQEGIAVDYAPGYSTDRKNKISDDMFLSGAIVKAKGADVDSTIYRAPKELKGFRKIFLKAGEEKTVSVTLDKRAFAYYNVAIGDWHVESGAFKILVGASSRDIRLEGSVEVQSTVEAEIPDDRASAPSYYGGDPMHVPDAEFEAVLGHEIPPSVRDERLPLTLTNTFEDAKNGKWGGRINRLMGKMLDPDSMAGALAVQSPIKLFIVDSMGYSAPRWRKAF